MLSQSELGRILYDAGKYTEAFPLLLQAARKEKDATALYLLGRLYDRGQGGVTRHAGKAAKWYRKAADLGLAEAQTTLGRLYNYGRGVPQDYCSAVKWYRMAADQGFARAQDRLGFAYECGDGVPQDDYQAVQWYRKAADQGFAPAQYNLSLAYEYGYGVLQNHSIAREWYLKAAKQGYAPAFYSLGRMATHGRESARWLQLAADLGHAPAQNKLGWMHAFGLYVPRSDCKAAELFRKAADQEYPDAQYGLGLMYEEGRGVPQSSDQATIWFQKAAEHGLQEAQYKLGADPFPPPPVPGNADIQPLTSDTLLREEGLVMHHCVASHAGIVHKGEGYVYRMLKPVRATVEIRPVGIDQRWTVSEIVTYCNAEPDSKSIAAVWEWLEQHNAEMSKRLAAETNHRPAESIEALEYACSSIAFDWCMGEIK